MDSVLIWGTGSYYDRYVANWVSRNEVNVLAFISGETTVCRVLDGRPIIRPEAISNFEYDYIIIASNSYDEIKRRALTEFKIPIRKLINGKVIKHPCFNWKRYVNILKSEVTLIAEACYGGYIYNQLGLQFNSPFINTRIEEYDYLKLLEHLEYYLQQPIICEQDIESSEDIDVCLSSPLVSWGKAGYPIFVLGDVKLHAIHAESADSYMESWIRRSKRINLNNTLAMMIIENDDVADRFSKLNIKNKIGFYYKETGCKDIVCLKEWDNFKIRLRSGHDFLSYVHHLFWDEKFIRYIDIFKMLNGENDFIRMY